MRLYDAHCHLNEEHVFPRREEFLQRFVDVGGKGIVNTGASDFYNQKGVEIAKTSPLCKATIGLHPESFVDENIDIQEKIKNLKDMVIQNRDFIVGIGECGIDLHFPGSEALLSLQKELFAAQCELARELDLPLVVHSRDAFDQTLDVLRHFTDLTVYFHCWGYGTEEIKKLRGLKIKSLFIGFCGNVTYKKADMLRESLKLVPLDSLLLETDAPWLAPQTVRGQENEPANVRYVYNFVSEVLGISEKKLATQLEANFQELYNG